MFLTVLVSLSLFFFGGCLRCVYFGHNFSCKKLVLINLNAVIKIYSKMWKLCMHVDHDYFVYSINFKRCKLQSQTSIIAGNNNPFSIKPSVEWVKISEKTSIFPV